MIAKNKSGCCLYWRGFVYRKAADRLISRTSGEHPPTPPGYRMTRSVGRIVRGGVVAHIIEFKRIAGDRTVQRPSAQPGIPASAGLYTQVPEHLHPEVDHGSV